MRVGARFVLRVAGIALFVAASLIGRETMAVGPGDPLSGTLCGYERSLAGGGFPYHAPQPDARTSLLIRSESDTARIAWLTAPVPGGADGEFVRFLMLAAIDVNREDPRRWTMRVGGRDAFTIETPRETGAPELAWGGPEGASLVFREPRVDKYGDLMGFLLLTVPRAWTRPGLPLEIEVRGEGALSRTWFMVYEYATRDRVTVRSEQAVRRGAEPEQVLQVEVVRYAAPCTAEVTVGPRRFPVDLAFGYNVHYLAVPEIREPLVLPVRMEVAGSVVHQGDVSLRPVPRRTVHLLSHSHVDIGYTHEQSEVERIQWGHLEHAAALARRTRDLPPEARFRWNTEVAWAVDSYLREKPPEARAALVEAVRSGAIELDALFANELTALCSPAELLESTAAARRAAAACGVELTSAMITDIPGFTWSLVPVLARSGVRYFSIGPNRGHRIGRVLERWGDRPFWWESQSGEERVLCLVHGEGYSLFHAGLYATPAEGRLEPLLLPVLARLTDAAYPYENFMLRYSVGSDNGPPHDSLPEIVREWNERYLTPRLVISTVNAAFAALEKEAGSDLPTVRGDMTAFWEDGAASTARETAMGRAAAERLAQAEAAWTILSPESYPADEFRDAWRRVLLWDEHTWGSWNSISEPDADLTRNQWAAKRGFALAADSVSRRLLAAAMKSDIDGRTMPPGTPGNAASIGIEVVNTEAWARTDLASIPADRIGSSPVRVLDENGSEVPSQRLRSGEIVFLAREVPPLGSRAYRLEPGDPACVGPFVFTPAGLESDLFALRIDPADGSIRSLVWKPAGLELVDPSASPGLNGYLYVAGRDPAAAVGADEVRIEPGEAGPLVASLRVFSHAPGCALLEREIVLVAGVDRIECVNTFDKTAVRAPEAVHMAFPLRVPDGTVRYDLAFGLCRAEADQLPGANRNHLTVAYAADVSGAEFGVSLACPDAPLLEVGALRADPIVTGWDERLDPSSLLYAYVMNNYWETNYRAEQDGRVRLRHLLRPHGPADPVACRRFGIAARRPLLVRAGGRSLRALPAPVSPGIEIAGMRPMPDGVRMVLYNAAEEAVVVRWSPPPSRVRVCDLDGGNPAGLARELILPTHGVRSVLVEGSDEDALERS